MLSVNIRTDNAAFGDGNFGVECARILRQLATRVEDYDGVEQFQTVRDVNGNDVGRWKAVDEQGRDPERDTPRAYRKNAARSEYEGGGKFPDRLAEALYSADHDETDGDVTTFGLWFGLVKSHGRKKQAYVVTEDGQGFVDYERFDNAKDAQHAFDLLSASYAEFESGE